MSKTSHPFRAAGAALAAFGILVNVPYALLIARFGYDDVLREPPATVLARFHEGGPELVLIWFAFALSALGFAIAAAMTGRAIRSAGAPWPSFGTATGVASGLAQTIGLIRWVFVIPMLATLSVDPSTGAATRDAAIVVYTMLHQYAGVAIGEHLGQTLLAVWTACVSLAILRGRVAPAILGWIGLATIPFWIVGQSELLATAIPGFPVVEVTPVAFIAWDLWAVVLGCVWLFRRADAR